MSAPVGSILAVPSAAAMRSIAHELRQPLSTIESIAYYLTLVLRDDGEKVHEQLQRIQQLVEQSNWILTSAQQLAEPLSATREPLDLEELVTQTISSRFPATDAPLLQLAGDLPPVESDPGLARALIENLLTLFRLIATLEHPVTVRTAAALPGVILELSTSASGYRTEPSLGPGATLSLDCARRIVDAHRGSLSLDIDPASGIRLRVMLP